MREQIWTNGGSGYAYIQNQKVVDSRDASLQYVTFEALEETIFSFNKVGEGDLYYSIDNGDTWEILNSISPIINKGDVIMWKSNIIPASDPSGNRGIGVFNSTGKFNVSGNVMSLLYGDVDQFDLSSKPYALYGLFDGCTTIISAKNLKFPANILSKCCYQAVFRGCSNLIEAPELPATKLYNGCYQAMFRECISLNKTPILNARDLDFGCYANMFFGCTALTEVPELPATTLAEECYLGMFQNCSNIKKTPKLKAKKLVTKCYYNMFNGCTLLHYVTMLADNISASECITHWLGKVSSNGIFIKSKKSNLSSGGSGIPEGWDVNEI